MKKAFAVLMCAAFVVALSMATTGCTENKKTTPTPTPTPKTTTPTDKTKTT